MTKTIQRVNYHTHCDRCRHARGSAEEYVEEAVRAGVSKLGFSDHMPFYDDRFGLRMPYAELDEYLGEITALREAYRDSLTITRGFEGEYVREDRAYYEKLLAREDCDYLLLGQHFYEKENGELINVYQLPDTRDYEIYAANIVEAMRTGYFRYAAHPDLIFLNDLPWDAHCERACDIIVEGAAKYGFALEYNANGFRRGKKQFSEGERYQYPLDRFWEKVKEAGLSVYVGSDCHDPEQVYDGIVEMACGKLEELGIAVRTDWV